MRNVFSIWVFARAIELSHAHTTHECIHDSEIVPSLLSHEHHPFKVVQPDAEYLGPTRLRRLANATGRQDVLQRRLVAGRGNKFRITADFTYLEKDKYHCTSGSGNVENVDTKKPDIACTPDDVVGTKMKDYIKDLTNAAIAWFTKALRVKHPIQGQMQLKKYCYQYVPPPNKDAGTAKKNQCYRSRNRPADCDFKSPQTDFYLYVTANPTQGSTLAWALSCQSDESSGRPIVGFVNFGPAKLTRKKEKWKSELSTAIHEISHSLGFSSSKFDDFIDDQGNPLGESNVVKTIQSSELGHEVKRIVTPRVVQQVKNQFGCFDWPDAGGELEDYGGSGTAGSHWEKRVFRDEFMTGTDSSNPVISAVSLALFEDSGWYTADYSVAEHLHWGHKGGCNFGANKCSTWDERFFCGVAQDGCSHNRIYKGYCNLATFTSHLPGHHQYFPGEPTKGGKDAHADYCPFVNGYGNQNCQNPAHVGKQSEKVFGEKYGEDSLCFDADVIAKGYGNRQGQRCYTSKCEDGLLTITIGGNDIKCPRGGGDVALKQEETGFKGNVRCPPAREICIAAPEVTSEPSAKADATSDAVMCKSEVELALGKKAAVKLTKDQVACLRLRLQSTVVGRIEVVANGNLGGMLYMQSSSKSPKQTGVVTDAGETKDGDDVPDMWPSAQQHDAKSRITSSSREPVPTNILESSSEILFSFVADKSVDGSFSLELRCLHDCLRGRCQNGECKCPPRYAGLRCEDKTCENDCSGHGVCDATSGRCNCNVQWRGDSCSEKEQPKKPADAKKGTVPIGGWAFFYVTCDSGSSSRLRLEYRLNKVKAGSAPMLYAQTGRSRPSSSRYVTRDLASFQSQSDSPAVTMEVSRFGGATIGIYNSPEYGYADLEYTGEVTCTSAERNAPRPCPRTRHGDCNKHGTCKLDKERNAEICECADGYAGNACETVLPKEDSGSSTQLVPMVLKQNEVGYIGVNVKGSDLGKDMFVKIAGQQQFMFIVVNKGGNKPKPSAIRTCDAGKDCSNCWDRPKFKFRGMVSQVRIKDVRYTQYQVMIVNKYIGRATLSVEISFGDSPGSYSVINDLAGTHVSQLESMQSFAAKEDAPNLVDDPIVPLQLVGEDGRLPDPVLALSSRSLVEGMASSKEMRLLKIEEFCSQSKSGLYVKCSNIEGTLTVCTDRPAVIFYDLHKPELPRDITDFKTRSTTKAGAPSKQWEHLRSWQDACLNYKQIPVDKGSNYIGVAALEGGQYVTFTAVMQGKSSLFLTDAGAIRPFWGIFSASIVSALVTAALMSSIYFGNWYRKRRAMQNAKRFTNILRHSVAATHERRMTEMSAHTHKSGGSLNKAAHDDFKKDDDHLPHKHDHLHARFTVEPEETEGDTSVVQW